MEDCGKHMHLIATNTKQFPNLKKQIYGALQAFKPGGNIPTLEIYKNIEVVGHIPIFSRTDFCHSLNRLLVYNFIFIIAYSHIQSKFQVVSMYHTCKYVKHQNSDHKYHTYVNMTNIFIILFEDITFCHRKCLVLGIVSSKTREWVHIVLNKSSL